MPALELNQTNAALPLDKGHAVSSTPWGYHATTVGGRKNKTKGCKGGKSYKNRRRSRYTRQKQNKRTRKNKNKK
jgi:hypothetical protein